MALGNFYTSDARILNSGIPTTTGRKAITAFYGSMIRAGIDSCHIITDGVWGSDHKLIVEEGRIAFIHASGQVAVKGIY